MYCRYVKNACQSTVIRVRMCKVADLLVLSRLIWYLFLVSGLRRPLRRHMHGCLYVVSICREFDLCRLCTVCASVFFESSIYVVLTSNESSLHQTKFICCHSTSTLDALRIVNYRGLHFGIVRYGVWFCSLPEKPLRGNFWGLKFSSTMMLSINILINFVHELLRGSKCC